jgi:hypothetical protein
MYSVMSDSRLMRLDVGCERQQGTGDSLIPKVSVLDYSCVKIFSFEQRSALLPNLAAYRKVESG